MSNELALGGPASTRLRDRLATGSIYSFLTIIAAQLLAMATSIIYARLLGKDNLGVFAIFVQVTGLVAPFIGLGLSTPITKFVAEYLPAEKNKLERLLSTSFTITMVATVTVSFIYVAASEFIGVGLYRNPDLAVMIRLSALFFILSSLSYFGSAVLQGIQAIRMLSLLSVMIEGVTVPLTLISIAAFGLVGAAAGGVFVIVISGSLLFWFAWRALQRAGVHISLTFHKESAGTLGAFVLPLLLSTLVVRLSLLYQSTFIALQLGYGDTGLFKVASTLYRIVLFVPGAISVPLLPVASELFATRAPAQTKKNLTLIVRTVSFIGVPLALAIGFAAKPIIAILFGTDYLDASPLVFVLTISGFVEMLSIVAVNFLLGEGRTRLLLGINVPLALITVASTTVFVSQYGLLGIGYAFLLGAVFHLLSVLLALVRRDRLDSKGITKALAVAVVGFVIALVAFTRANVQSNLAVAAAIVLGYTAVGWALLAPDERRMITSAVSAFLRGVRTLWSHHK